MSEFLIETRQLIEQWASARWCAWLLSGTLMPCSPFYVACREMREAAR